MNSIKALASDVAYSLRAAPAAIAFTLVAAPMPLWVAKSWYDVYSHDIPALYQQAIERNADTDQDGHITQIEELIFRQTLIREIGELSEKGRDLDEISDWLKTR